jgi:hypothetical protein
MNVSKMNLKRKKIGKKKKINLLLYTGLIVVA